jgi:hypothetical protein
MLSDIPRLNGQSDSGESMAPWPCGNPRVRTCPWRRIKKKIDTFLGVRLSKLSSVNGGGEVGAQMVL